MGGCGLACEMRRAGTRAWLTDEAARYGIKVRQKKVIMFSIDHFKNSAPLRAAENFNG
jgi:hypothetical protein